MHDVRVLGLTLLAMSIVFMAACLYRQQRSRETVVTDPAEPLRALATQLQLSDEAALSGDGLEFTRSGFSVRLRVRARTQFDLEIETEDRLPSWLHIIPRRDGQDAPAGTTETRDPFFDRAFWTVGSARPVSAVLRHPLRAGLLNLRTVTVRPGVVRSRCTASRTTHVERWVTGVIALVEQLSKVPENLDASLLSALSTERTPAVRMHIFKMLLAREVDPEIRQQTLIVGLEDRDPKVRCLAALQSQEPAAIAALEQLADGFDVPENIRLSAFHALLRLKRGPELVPLLLSAAAGPAGRLSQRALGWAVGYGGARVLKELVARPRLPLSTLVIAINLAQQRGVTDVGEELVRILSWNGTSNDRRLLAIQGLARLGTASAVPALKKAARLDPSLADDVSLAVTSIQSRCRTDAAGGLSLVEHRGGQLALTGETGLAVVPVSVKAPSTSSPTPPRTASKG